MGAVNTRLVPCYDDSISHSSEERYNPANRQEFAYDSLVMSASAPASLSSIPRAPSDGKAPSDTRHLPHSSATPHFHRGLSMPTQPAPLQVPKPRHPGSGVPSHRADSPEAAGTPPGAPPLINNIVPQQRIGAAVVTEERQSQSGGAVDAGASAGKRPSAEIESSTHPNSTPQVNSSDIPTALAEKAQSGEVGMGKRVASMDVPVATPLLVSEPPCTGEMVKPLKSAMKQCGGMRKNYSMPNFSAASSFGNIDEEDCKEGSPRRGIRFSEKGHMMVKIDSHKDLTAVERNQVYYGHADMQSFVKVELKRRQIKGIKSMSALAPDAEDVGEIDDDDAPSF